MPTFDEDVTVNGIIRVRDGFRPLTDDWEIARNGEHLEIREPEHSNKVWAKFNDDRSLHLIGTPNLHVDGKVGIGTTNPQAKLEVQAPWSDWMFLNQQRDTEGGGGFHIHNPWGNSDQSQGDPSRNRLEIAYKTSTGQDLWGQFVLHGPTGNVGLGAVNPRAKLEVQAPWSDWMFLNQQRDTEGGGGFHIHNPWGNSDQSQGDPSRNRLEIAYKTSTGQDLWGQFVLHGPTGNVGIGTVNPQAKLDVNGDIKVKDWTLSVPDYVFDQDYELRNLDELRTYVDSHKHLPEIPSALQVREEGVNLGEFCMSLLKKIEEISLYMLQQHEVIQAQSERLAKLERSNSM